MKRAIVGVTLYLALVLLASVTVNAMDESTQKEDSSEVQYQTTSSTSETRYRRALTHHRHDDDDDDERRHASRPFIRRKRPRPSDSSSSLTQLKGVLRIVVIGNGEMCFVKIFQRRYSYRAQYGDTTSTSAFLNLYGHGECEPGAKGVAYGVVRAGVIAIAHQRGPQCEAKVMSYAITKTRDLDPNDGVSVTVGGAAGGEALALCP